MLAFSGPGYLVAVGYMDPGNWATDLAGGSAFGYRLLSIILLSNLLAILLQSLCAKLGIVTGRELAQACRDPLALGDPPREILRTAEAEHCDLIAMASHGHRLLGDLLFGSTIREVRHRTSIPGLLVRAGAKDRAG